MRYAAQDNTPPVQPANLNPEANVPWGPNAHAFNNDSFSIYFQNLNNIQRVNDNIPSWTSTMDFLKGPGVSLFAFTEPYLQWNSNLLRAAKDTQQRFFSHGQLVTSESNLQFPRSFKPGGTFIGINSKWATQVTA
jgi:hypothetical protein